MSKWVCRVHRDILMRYKKLVSSLVESFLNNPGIMTEIEDNNEDSFHLYIKWNRDLTPEEDAVISILTDEDKL